MDKPVGPRFDLDLKKYFSRTDQNYSSEPHKNSKTFWLQKKFFVGRKISKEKI